ncbi:MAG: hypothetical protein HYZ15_15020 [Sphingobacteriales bacterium]|nr:hypothetical protein [Sphingobacteriales bacterium]
MKNFTPVIAAFSLFFCFSVSAQTNLPGRAIQLTGGYARHGSGDYNGISFGAEYIRYLGKRVSLNYNFRSSINNGKDKIIIADNNAGTTKDGSIRFTTAGVQAGVDGGFSFIRTARHELLTSLGVFARYQSASNGTDGYRLYYPNTTGVPAVLVEYMNRTPQQTIAVGGLFQLRYNYTIKNKISLGFSGGFQTDSNGDAILQGGITIARRF